MLTLDFMNTSVNSTPSGDALQHARAAHLRELFEPWSLRRLETRTGIGRGTLQGRFNGTTAITMADIEILAPVIRMSPVDLFAELLSVGGGNRNGPASEETGPRKLPDLDSNQEPAGSTPGAEIQGSAYPEVVHLADRPRRASKPVTGPAVVSTMRISS